MKSSQPNAKAPTARQNRVAKGKASPRATPVDLRQKPIQPRTWRRKSQPLQNATPGTQNACLASFRKTAGFTESASELGDRSEPAPFLLQPQKSSETVRSVRSGDSAAPTATPKNPETASFRKTASSYESAPEPVGPSEPARLLLQPQKTSKTVRSVRSGRANDHPRNLAVASFRKTTGFPKPRIAPRRNPNLQGSFPTPRATHLGKTRERQRDHGASAPVCQKTEKAVATTLCRLPQIALENQCQASCERYPSRIVRNFQIPPNSMAGNPLHPAFA